MSDHSTAPFRCTYVGVTRSGTPDPRRFADLRIVLPGANVVPFAADTELAILPVAMAEALQAKAAELDAVEAAVRRYCPVENCADFEDEDVPEDERWRYVCYSEDGEPIIATMTLAEAVEQTNACWTSVSERLGEAEIKQDRARQDLFSVLTPARFRRLIKQVHRGVAPQEALRRLVLDPGEPNDDRDRFDELDRDARLGTMARAINLALGVVADDAEGFRLARAAMKAIEEVRA